MRLLALSAEQGARLVRPPLAAVVAAAALVGASAAAGGVVARTWVRELGPLVAALVAAVRLGPALAGELAGMRATSQIDALRTLAGSTARHLVAPRLAAAAAVLPLLAALADAVGLAAAWAFSAAHGGAAPAALASIAGGDLAIGLARASLSGVVLAAIGCQVGLAARGGAREVGVAAARAATAAALAVLALHVLLGAGAFA